MTPRTILLIEGHGDTREVYGEILRRAGYRVLAAKDGGEGVRLAREHLP
ncbi:MAG: transcriptional regulator, partial [Gemmatimonadetes bacterium]|nr:transcriptional regulator [Gemmatimonadota bacterium]